MTLETGKYGSVLPRHPMARRGNVYYSFVQRGYRMSTLLVVALILGWLTYQDIYAIRENRTTTPPMFMLTMYLMFIIAMWLVAIGD